jgi:DNA repair protein RadC
MPKTFTVSDLPCSERPRERLQKLGAESLSQQEILAAILGRGGAGLPVLTLAQSLLSRFKDLKGIAEGSLEELMQVDGIGLAKACQLKAAFDVARRLRAIEAEPRAERTILRAQDVFELIRPEIGNANVEHFFLLSLDTRGKLIRSDEISRGSLSSTVVHPREVFKAASAACAAAVIFVHNHPSGDPEPSDDDIALTKRLISAGQVLGIPVQDHIIITERSFASLRSRNLI